VLERRVVLIRDSGLTVNQMDRTGVPPATVTVIMKA
jgi:hypothetical protein